MSKSSFSILSNLFDSPWGGGDVGPGRVDEAVAADEEEAAATDEVEVVVTAGAPAGAEEVFGLLEDWFMVNPADGVEDDELLAGGAEICTGT